MVQTISEEVHILDFGFTFLYRMNPSEEDSDVWVYRDGALLRMDEIVERTHQAMIELFTHFIPNPNSTHIPFMSWDLTWENILPRDP